MQLPSRVWTMVNVQLAGALFVFTIALTKSGGSSLAQSYLCWCICAIALAVATASRARSSTREELTPYKVLRCRRRSWKHTHWCCMHRLRRGNKILHHVASISLMLTYIKCEIVELTWLMHTRYWTCTLTPLSSDMFRNNYVSLIVSSGKTKQWQ